MINTDKALDILPYVADIYDKLEMQEYIEKMKKEYKKNPVSKTEAGLNLFKYIFKNSTKIKDEIFNIVAIIEEKEVEDIKKQSLALTMASLKEIFTDKEFTDFFKTAMQ